MRNWSKGVRRSRGSGHISIVDDDEAVVYTLTRLMRQNGYSAAGFTDVRGARIGIERRAPNLLISDIAMPETSGIDFAIEVTERFPNCKVLLFSARLDAHQMVEDMGHHGYGFAVAMKPLDPRDLMRIVRGLLAPARPGHESSHQLPFVVPHPAQGI